MKLTTVLTFGILHRVSNRVVSQKSLSKKKYIYIYLSFMHDTKNIVMDSIFKIELIMGKDVFHSPTFENHIFSS